MPTPYVPASVVPLDDDLDGIARTFKIRLEPLSKTHCYMHGFEVAKESFADRSISIQNEAYATPLTTHISDFAPHGAIPISAWPIDNIVVNLYSFERIENIGVRGGLKDTSNPDGARQLGRGQMLDIYWTDAAQSRNANIILLLVAFLSGVATSLLIEAWKG